MRKIFEIEDFKKVSDDNLNTILESFKSFCQSAISDGMYRVGATPIEFLKTSLEVYEELLESEKKE